MAGQEGSRGSEMSRRKFLTLAGVGAVFGALVYATMRQGGVQNVIKTASTNLSPNKATAGKRITTAVPPPGPSLLQKLLSGKL